MQAHIFATIHIKQTFNKVVYPAFCYCDIVKNYMTEIYTISYKIKNCQERYYKSINIVLQIRNREWKY